MTERPRFEIEIRLSDHPVRRVWCESGSTLSVGRAASSDLRIRTRGVERSHLSIAAGPERCRLVPRHGITLLDGRSLPPGGPDVPIPDGGEIRLGAEDGPLLVVLRRAALDGSSPDTARSPILQARGIAAGTLLTDIDIDVSEGEIVAVLGRSGSGKTTLLKCLAGLLGPDGGTVQFPGQAVEEPSRIAYVPQEEPLFSELTPEQTLHYAARLQEIPRPSIGPLVDEFEMNEFLRRPNALLSGGQRRRVSIAAALVGEPRTLLLDEPDSGLDPYHAGLLMEHLHHLALRRRIGVVMTTHSLLFSNLLHRIVVLDRGTIRAQGPPQEVATTFGVEDLNRIYQRLDDEAPPVGELRVQRFGRSRLSLRPRLPAWRRIATLVERGLLRRVARPVTWAGAILLPLLVGLSIRLVWWSWQEPTSPAELSAMPLLGFIAAIWLGLIAAVQSIVGELPLFRQEKVIGVTDLEYLLSKGTVLSLLVVGQSFLLGSVLLWQTPHDPGNLLAGLTTASLSGLALGLAVSALAPNRQTALRLVPLLMIPQILCSRLTGFPVVDRTPWLSDRILSRLTFTRHLEQIFGSPRILAEGFGAMGENWLASAGQLGAIVVALIGLTFVGLHLHDRRERRL